MKAAEEKEEARDRMRLTQGFIQGIKGMFRSGSVSHEIREAPGDRS